MGASKGQSALANFNTEKDSLCLCRPSYRLPPHRPPHVHVEHQGQKAVFDFDGNLTQGELSSRTAAKLVKEWLALHRDELKNNWQKMEEGKQLDQIAPLE